MRCVHLAPGTMRTFALLVLALLLPACDSTGGSEDVAYTFSMRQDGDAVASGRFELDAVPTASASSDGTYTLTASGGGPF